MPTIYTAKFIELIKTLTQVELKAFECWLQSPWFNTNKNLIRLLQELKPYHPGYAHPKLTKEWIFGRILPNGKFSVRRMNNLLSEAYLAAERFLVSQSFAQDVSLQRDLLAQELQRLAHDDWFFRHAYQTIDQLEARAVKDWKDHLYLLRMYRRIYQHPSQGPRLQSGHTTVVQMDTQIDVLYLLEKAVVINEMIARNRLFKGEQHNIAAALNKWQVVAEGIEHPALTLYRLRFEITGQVQLPHYLAMELALFQQFEKLNARDQQILLVSLLNDAKQLIKSGQLDITASLPLYKLGLTTGAALIQGRLSANTYATIVTASNTQGDFAFTRHFVNTYIHCLPTSVQGDCTHWARAHTAYWQKKLQDCLDVLQEYHFRTPYFQLISRVLTTQAYFDMYLQDKTYAQYLFNYFDSFEKWLRRDKVWAKSSHLAFLRFVQYCRTLARVYADVEPNAQKIDQLLERKRNVQALNWLRQKREEVVRLVQRGHSNDERPPVV